MEGPGELSKEEEEMIGYLKENFNPFLESLIVDIVRERPQDSYEYILNWLEGRGKEIQATIDTKKANY